MGSCSTIKRTSKYVKHWTEIQKCDPCIFCDIHRRKRLARINKFGILTAAQRKLGEYWSSLETRSTASGGMRLWNIWKSTLEMTCCVVYTSQFYEGVGYNKLHFKYLVPWMSFNLRKFELIIVGIHTFNFFPCRSA